MLEVTGIEKRYRGRTILKNVSFRANPGECIGIVGGNGCGKTTLLSILAGIRKPDRGSIRIDGQEALGRHRLLEEKIAYVPQENPLIPELTAFDNYRLWFRGKRREMERDLECGVGHVLGVDRFLKTQAGRLSGGEKKRLSIAAALSGRADILILDEPTRGIDVGAKNEIYKLMNRLAAEGKSIIMISSEMTEVLRMSDRIIVMCEGKITGNIDISEATQEHIMNHATRNIN